MSNRGTIFLTGATGRTGREVLRLLLKRDYLVRCLVRGGPDHRASSVLASFAHSQLQPVEGDLEDPGSGASGWVPAWAEGLRDCDAAIHVADIGLIGNVVAACDSQNVRRLICVSSTRRFTSFADPTAERVIAAEKTIEQAGEQAGLDATILQSTMIYGGGRDRNVGRIAEWISRHRRVPLIAGGEKLVQPIHAHDVAAAILCALEKMENAGTTPGGGIGRSLIIAGPEAMTWRAMIEAVAANAGQDITFVSIPKTLALLAARVMEILNISRPFSPAEIRRQLEDRNFDIGPARAALPGWEPRPFDPGD